MKLLALLLLATCIFHASADNFAVLVAGSNTYGNYRHQADICHAYQIFLKTGVPAKNIVVMAYDDIAKDPENPFPGQVFNKPATGEGVDVYAGCNIDYKGNQVTPTNFLAVITGDIITTKGKKVLKSKAGDNVFINFSDHGAAGLIAFPSDYLYADDLLKSLAKMTTKKMYNELTFYLEACESGSMFENLPANTKMYALSASSPDESSWGCYCPPDDVVNGKELDTCLGDLFSVNWMEDTDAADMSTETLDDQFSAVKTKTDKSQVMQWGDLTFTSEVIQDFFGGATKKKSFFEKVMDGLFAHTPEITANTSTKWDSRDNQILYLTNKYKKNPSEANYEALLKEMNMMKYFTEAFEAVKEEFNLTGVYEKKTTNFDCYRTMINTFTEGCGKPNESSLKYFKYFYEACQDKSANDFENYESRIMNICSQL